MGTLAVLLAAASATPTSRAAAPGGPGVVLANVVYARVPSSPPLRLDLYLPEDQTQPAPVVLWVHGGGWASGSKDDGPAAALASDGYAVASVEYRLSGVATFPTQIHDVKGAVRWLRAHAARYNLAADRIAAWGPSAGGHLAALLGTSAGVAALEGDVGGNLAYPSDVAAVVDWYGPTDFLQMDRHMLPGSTLRHNAPDSPESLLLGCPIEGCPDAVAAANPISYVTPQAPPFLIMHGDQDLVVPYQQSELLAGALADAGAAAELVIVKGGAHGGRAFEESATMQRVRAFLTRTIGGGA